MNYEHITTQEGLVNNFVNCFAQDVVGFLWIGTQDGLSRYDGENYKTYRADINNNYYLLSNQITSLAFLSDSLMYVGTTAGLHILNINQDIIYPIEELIGEDIANILVDNENKVWLTTQSGVSYTFDTQQKKWITLSDKYPFLSGKRITAISEVTIEGKSKVVLTEERSFKKGHSYISMFYTLEERQWKPFYYETDTYLETILNDTLVIQKGVLKHENSTRLNYLKEGLHKKYIKGASKEEIRISESLQAKPYNDKLFLTLLYSILVIDRYTYDIIDRIELGKIQPGKNNSIKSTFIDKSGNLWVATYGNGAMMFPIQNMRSIKGYRSDIVNLSKTLSYNSIRAIYEDPTTNNLWIGTYSSERVIDIFAKNGEKEILPIKISYAFSIKEDKKENHIIWVATYNGIIKVDKIRKEIKKGFFEDKLLSAFEVDTDSTLLFADTDSLYVFNTKTEQLQKKLRLDKITYLYKENNINTWIGTQTEGFILWNRNTDRMTHFNPEKDSALPSLYVKCIYRGTKGKLWVATSKGLYSYDEKTTNYKKFTQENGLSNNMVYAILEDDQYNLWLSTNKGISMFDISNKTFTKFDVNDGLQDNEYNTHAFHKSKSGRLFFGGVNGVDAFFPEDLIQNKEQPKMVLTGLKQSGENLKLHTPLHQLEEINIPSDSAQMLTFEFAALNFYQGERNQYAYKIEEISDRWINLNTKNELTLTNLTAGNYTLRIKGSNNHKNWSREELVIRISITPPFWQKNWFFLTLSFVFLTTVYALYRLRIYQVRKRQAELELQIKERTKELAAANNSKDQLFAIIAHDLRSPLIAFEDISKQIEYFIQKGKLNRLLELGDDIDTSVKNLNILLNNLLSWALIQQNHQIKIQAQNICLSKAIEDTKSIYKNVAQSNQVVIRNNIHERLEIFVDKESFQTILRNLVSNSLKYTPENGRITIGAQRKKDKVILSIKDTGVGMSKEMVNHILNQNTIQTHRGVRGEKGTGLGLILCQEFAQINNIGFQVESEIGRGTLFILTIPTSKQTV